MAPLQYPTVPTSQGNPRPQGRGPRNPHRQRVPSSTPEPASGTSPATLPRPWPPPPRPGQAAQAAQPRPPPPTPDKLQGTAPPAPGRFATAVAPPPPLPGSPSGRKAEWDQGGEITGGGADVLTSAPHPRPPSTSVRSLSGAPGLFLRDQGAPSYVVQDGDLGRKRRESQGEDNDESPQNGRGTRERSGGCEERRPGRSNSLSVPRILADPPSPPRWFPGQPSGPRWLHLSER